MEKELEEKLSRENPQAYKMLHIYEGELEKRFESEHPDVFRHISELREKEMKKN